MPDLLENSPIVAIDGYACLVPYMEKDDFFFLKTIIPSRKTTRDLLPKTGEEL